MNKWYGKIGFVERVETVPGVWKDVVTERNYYGDVLRNYKSWHDKQEVNEDIEVNNRIKIIADPYAYNHFHSMKYIEFYGSLWITKAVEPNYPFLTITIAGLYNGKTETVNNDSSSDS